MSRVNHPKGERVNLLLINKSLWSSYPFVPKQHPEIQRGTLEETMIIDKYCGRGWGVWVSKRA